MHIHTEYLITEIQNTLKSSKMHCASYNITSRIYRNDGSTLKLDSSENICTGGSVVAVSEVAVD